MPAKVLTIDLAQPLQPIWGIQAYDWLHILVRAHAQPIGWISISNNDHLPSVPVDRLHDLLMEQAGWALASSLMRGEVHRERPQAHDLPPITVVVCTRDRADQLAGCLQALLQIDYPTFEIVIVDNAPRTDETARLVASHPVRYVVEPRPGLDWARNRGISEATHAIVAFTDDDARPDTQWLRGLANAFADPAVMAVTGFVAPAELDTHAQFLFEFEYGGMGKGFHRKTFTDTSLPGNHLLWASACGVGANMAFRREVFATVGTFDVALDVGTASHGGGDVEMFARLLSQGKVLRYEPAALVWHIHRRSEPQLLRQIGDNGRSLGCFILTCLRNRSIGRKAAVQFLVRDWFANWIWPRLKRPGRLSRRHVLTEFFGLFHSPSAYAEAQRTARTLREATQVKAPHQMETPPSHQGTRAA